MRHRDRRRRACRPDDGAAACPCRPVRHRAGGRKCRFRRLWPQWRLCRRRVCHRQRRDRPHRRQGGGAQAAYDVDRRHGFRARHHPRACHRRRPADPRHHERAALRRCRRSQGLCRWPAPRLRLRAGIHGARPRALSAEIRALFPGAARRPRLPHASAQLPARRRPRDRASRRAHLRGLAGQIRRSRWRAKTCGDRRRRGFRPACGVHDRRLYRGAAGRIETRLPADCHLCDGQRGSARYDRFGHRHLGRHRRQSPRRRLLPGDRRRQKAALGRAHHHPRRLDGGAGQGIARRDGRHLSATGRPEDRARLVGADVLCPPSHAPDRQDAGWRVVLHRLRRPWAQHHCHRRQGDRRGHSRSERYSLFSPFGLVWAGGLAGLAVAQLTYWKLQAQDWWRERAA